MTSMQLDEIHIHEYDSDINFRKGKKTYHAPT